MNAPAEIAALLGVLALPLLVAQSGARRIDVEARAAFLTNAGGNGLTATVFGAYAGNIGGGSFVAIFLFAEQSTVIAASVVAVYTLGLVLCAVLAPVIRRRAAELGAVGMIDLIALSHGASGMARALIWAPLALVFVLRASVQIGALGVLCAVLLGMPFALATVLVATVIGGYLLIGGTRAAVETDIAQSLVILATLILTVVGFGELTFPERALFALGPYQKYLLVGIWFFLPWSPLLAPDNWQRLTQAESTATAQRGYLIAAVLCGVSFSVMLLVGLGVGNGDGSQAAFRALMPEGFGWAATAMLVAAIMSSIDTFIMPLTTGLGGRLSLVWLRFVTLALVAVAAFLAICFGNLLSTIITAFSALTVFLPATFGALVLKKAPKTALAAGGSMTLGISAALGISLFSPDSASLFGFGVSAVLYGVLALRPLRPTVQLPVLARARFLRRIPIVLRVLNLVHQPVLRPEVLPVAPPTKGQSPAVGSSESAHHQRR